MKSSELYPQRLYYSFADYTRRRFGTAAGKISIDTGYGCAHRRSGGCSFCSLSAFAPAYTSPALTVEEQWRAGKSCGRFERYYAYLQLGTNTGPGIDIPRIIAPLLNDSALCGIMVGTRPDAFDEDSCSSLADIGKRYDVWIEMGMQSADDAVLARVNRGHTFADFAAAVHRIHQSKTLRVSAHVIFGLPGESEEGMLNGIRELAALPVDGVKFHHLAVVRGTPLAEQYAVDPFPLLSAEAYALLVGNALALLPPSVVVERLVGDSHDEHLIAPRWDMNKHEVIALIRRHLAANGAQGSRCTHDGGS